MLAVQREETGEPQVQGLPRLQSSKPVQNQPEQQNQDPVSKELGVAMSDDMLA